MNDSELTVPRLCDILEAQGLLSSEERLRVANREQAQRAQLLEEAGGDDRQKQLVDAIDVVCSMDVPNAKDPDTVLTAAVIGEAIASHHDLKFLRFDLKQLDLELIKTTLSRPFALRHGIVPIGEAGDVLILAAAMALPTDVVEDLRRTTGNEVEVVVSAKPDIVAAIAAAFPDGEPEAAAGASASPDVEDDLPPRPSAAPPPAAKAADADLPPGPKGSPAPRPAAEPGVVSPNIVPVVEKHSAPPPARPSAQPMPRPSSQPAARPAAQPVASEEPAAAGRSPMLLAGGTLLVGFGLGLVTLAIFWNRGDDPEPTEDPGAALEDPGDDPGGEIGERPSSPGSSPRPGAPGRRPGGSRLHVRVELQNVPAGAAVLLDGRRINGTVMNVMNDGREHEIGVRAAGRSTWRHTFTPSDDVEIDTGLVRREPVRAPDPGAGPRPSPRPSPGPTAPAKAPQPNIVTDPGF